MSESVVFVLKYAGIALGLLLTVFVIALITPKIAAWIDKHSSKISPSNPERVKDDKFPDVKGIYDAQLPEKESKENNDNGDVKNG